MNREAGMALGLASSARTGVPDAWRRIDAAVRQWVLDHGGEPSLALIAGWASHAEGFGHSALPLDEPLFAGMPPVDEPLRAALQASPWVGDGRDAGEGIDAGESARPFVLDADHFYLLRNFRQERAVASRIAVLRQAASEAWHPLTSDDLLALFNASDHDNERLQREAVRAVVGKRFFVLTGGPGTGKTTTVLRMLLALAREHHTRSGALPLIRLAAPTGKAAQRLGESLRQGAQTLCSAAAPLPEGWQPFLDHVLRVESGTVHRLLGSRGIRAGMRHHAVNRLAADIVVVDEASMLDLGLLRDLLDALDEQATLVLVGDPDQLTSVGTGSILIDIVGALEASQQGDLVCLQHCFRADTTLVPIHTAVREGDVAAFAQVWSSAGDKALNYRVDSAGALHRRLAAWGARVQRSLLQANFTAAIDPSTPRPFQQMLASLREQQLLCALREGAFGALEVDAWLCRYLLRHCDALAEWCDERWFPGRAVMVSRNDPVSGLLNGDVGICVRLSDGSLRLAFPPTPDRPEGDGHGARLFEPSTLPAHEGAFALTVHKSQGSEYGHVAVLLPPNADNPLLTRQMLYTALSRARDSMELWGGDASRDRCIETPLRRHGRLEARLAAASE